LTAIARRRSNDFYSKRPPKQAPNPSGSNISRADKPDCDRALIFLDEWIDGWVDQFGKLLDASFSIQNLCKSAAHLPSAEKSRAFSLSPADKMSAALCFAEVSIHQSHNSSILHSGLCQRARLF
jgi:hypothetical protein